jgi:hypothetical protein
MAYPIGRGSLVRKERAGKRGYGKQLRRQKVCRHSVDGIPRALTGCPDDLGRLLCIISEQEDTMMG